MKFILHRRNTLQELILTPHKYGVEVDIRSQGEQLIIHHDPFITGESFDLWIASYKHGTLILNVKEEGLETRLISLMRLHNIDDYFFLDQSFPFIVKFANKGHHQCAVRVSEYESIDTALTLTGKIDWIWVDCFSRFPINQEGARVLKDAGFKLCIVSPELQGRDAELEISQLAQLLAIQDIQIDAVCTKRPDLWEKAVGHT